MFGLDQAQVRVICPDVGGGFGPKNGLYPEERLTAELARRLDRPVRWVETRSESMLGLGHGRAQVQHATIGGRRDGTVLALSLIHICNPRLICGASSLCPVTVLRSAEPKPASSASPV